MSFFKSFFYPLYDVSTSSSLEFFAIAGLPAHHGKLLVYTQLSAYRQAKVHPDLAALRSSLPPYELFSRATLVAKTLIEWDMVFVDAGRYRLEAVVGKRPLFDADVVIEVRPETSGSSLHMRSRSRMGRRDFGANAKRIREFFALVAK